MKDGDLFSEAWAVKKKKTVSTLLNSDVIIGVCVHAFICARVAVPVVW